MALICVIDILVIASLVAVTLVRDLESALPLLAFLLVLLPLESRIVIPGLFDLTSSRLAIITFAALFVVFPKKQSANSRGRSTPLKYLMLLAIVWSLVATANSIVIKTSLKTVLSQLLDFYFVYYMFFKTITRPETVRKILMAMVGAISVCCIFGFLEAYCGWGVISLFPGVQGRLGADSALLVDMERGIRVRATFPNAILFGVALALAIPLVLYLLTVVRGTLQRSFLWLSLMLMFLNIYKTQSRGPWMGLCISLVLLAYVSQKATRRRVLVLFLLAVSVLAIRSGVWQTIADTYASTFDPDSPEGSSYANRWDLIRIGKAAIDKSAERAMWGYGPESFYFLGLTTVSAEGHVIPSLSCDDAWLELAIETGYVGLLLAACLLFKSLGLTLKNYWKSLKPDKYLYGVLFINLVAFYFTMLSVASYAWGQQSSMLWILIALAMVYPRVAGRENASSQDATFAPGETEHAFAELTTA